MNTQTKPGLFTAIALMTLVNGIFNLIWGVGLILLSGGVLLLCVPIAPLPIILGGFEIAYAMKLLAVPPLPVRPSYAIAWWEIACVLVGNVFSLVVGILVLVFYSDQVVKDYFAGLNGTLPPPPPKPDPAPVQPADFTHAPVEPQVEDLLYEAETPVKPKRVRKIADK